MINLYDVFFPKDDELPDGLTDAEKVLITQARNAGHRIDAGRVKRVAEAAARPSRHTEEIETARQTIRQAAIDAGFLQVPEPPAAPE